MRLGLRIPLILAVVSGMLILVTGGEPGFGVGIGLDGEMGGM